MEPGNVHFSRDGFVWGVKIQINQSIKQQTTNLLGLSAFELKFVVSVRELSSIIRHPNQTTATATEGAHRFCGARYTTKPYGLMNTS